MLAGVAVVNGPVWVLLFGGMGAAIAFGDGLGLTGWLGLASVAGPILPAWAWWSVALPRWRVWALEHVDDREALIDRAVASRLMWPPGHVFEWTEVRPRSVRERERLVGWDGPTKPRAT